MLLQYLQRIPDFAHVCPTELAGVARNARVLCLPPARWLARNHRDLGAHFYLLRGRVHTEAPRQRLRARAFGAVRHVYPGCGAVRTASPCQLLRIADEQRDFLLRRSQNDLAADPAEGWLTQFLNSRMMTELPMDGWQRLLAAFVPRTFARGAPIIRAGSEADCCFVVERGHAVVHRGARTLAHLGPGDFFGEDALVLGTTRTADVTALAPVLAHAIDLHTFNELLLFRLVQAVTHVRGGRLLNLGPARVAGAVRVRVDALRDQAGQLDPKVTYFVVGGSVAERYLCAFLLLQRGLRASPVDGTPP